MRRNDRRYDGCSTRTHFTRPFIVSVSRTFSQENLDNDLKCYCCYTLYYNNCWLMFYNVRVTREKQNVDVIATALQYCSSILVWTIVVASSFAQFITRVECTTMGLVCKIHTDCSGRIWRRRAYYSCILLLRVRYADILPHRAERMKITEVIIECYACIRL